MKICSWERAKELCEEDYGTYVDEEEGFFICPECGEPIYKCDWEEYKDWNICPICNFDYVECETADFEFEDEEEEEEW